MNALDETRFQVAREHGWDINQLTERQMTIVESEAPEQLQSDGQRSGALIPETPSGLNRRQSQVYISIGIKRGDIVEG
jgi:hypothetical protein